MRKIPTLFVRDPDDRAHVLPEVNPGCEWVFTDPGATAIRKYDGTCVRLDDNGDWWARREIKPGKPAPANYEPISTDPATGKTMGWEPIGQSAFAKFHAEALNYARARNDRTSVGTYELVGPKINGNPENWDRHGLILHSEGAVVGMRQTLTYDWLHDLMVNQLGPLGIEGVVWHRRLGAPNTEMAKLKVRDFGGGDH
jgi:hypothetical protein